MALSFFRRFSPIQSLDELLRGQRTSAPQLCDDSALPMRIFVPWAIILGVVYGFFMGWYALGGGRSDAFLHMGAVMLKLPLLFVGTLLVTFPSLYVFNALIGCRLGFRETLRLIVATIVVNLAIAASLGPILGFFTLSTKSYGFMVLLNVALLGIAGFVSLGFLMRALSAVARDPRFAPPPPPPSPYPPTQPMIPQTTPRTEGSAVGIFWVWIITYGIVGAQMGWILRPFIGSPNAPFELFRTRSGSFLQGVYNAFHNLVDGTHILP